MEAPASRSVCFAFWRILLAAAIILGPSALASTPAVARPLEQTPDEHWVYIPMVEHFSSYLISPENGAVLDTLIPTYQFYVDLPSPETEFCLAYGTAPAPNCMIYFGGYGKFMNFRYWQNLLPNTVYYWRVGIHYTDDPEPTWVTREYRFTSGSGGVILPAPKLLKPDHNAALPQSALILSWEPVAGAVEYTYFTYWPMRGTSLSRTSGTSKDFRNSYGYFATNVRYEWWVQARNNYAWGLVSEKRYFTLTSVNGSAPLGSAVPAPQGAYSFVTPDYQIVIEE